MHVNENAAGYTPPQELDTALGVYLILSEILKHRPSPSWGVKPDTEKKIDALILDVLNTSEPVNISLDVDECRYLYWRAALGAVLSISRCDITDKVISANDVAPTLQSLEHQLKMMRIKAFSIFRILNAYAPNSGVSQLEDENEETPIEKSWALQTLMHVLPEHRDNKTSALAYCIEPAEIGGAKQATPEVKESINAASRALIRMGLHVDGLALIVHQSLKLPSIDTGFMAALVGAVCDASGRTAAALVNLAHAIETARKNTANGKRGAWGIEDELELFGFNVEAFAEDCLNTYNDIHLGGMCSDSDAYIEAAKLLKRKYALTRFSAKSCRKYCTIGRKNRKAKRNKNP